VTVFFHADRQHREPLRAVRCCRPMQLSSVTARLARHAISIGGPLAWLASCSPSGEEQHSGGAGPDAAILTSGDATEDADDGVSRPDVSPTDGTGASVSGTVVDFATSRPLANRLVVIGATRTKSDADGHFSVSVGAAMYDAVVVEPDGSSISIFRGLHRRDPRLPHKRSTVPDATTTTAVVRGALSGAMSLPLSSSSTAGVYLFSAVADAQEFLGGGTSPILAGPAYGPLELAWTGASSADAELVALGVSSETTAGPSDGGPAPSAWFAARSLTLTGGDSVTVDLSLAPVAVRTLSGSVQVPSGYRLVQKQVFYRLPIVHAVIDVVNQQDSSPSFGYAVPDLTNTGAQLCVEDAADPGAVMAQHCGLTFDDTALQVALEPAPALSSPTEGATVTESTQFSWSAFDTGIHRLKLETVGPTSTTPNIYLFTTTVTTTWPDLTDVGVPFTTGVSYRCTIEGLGPYATLDDALGPDGVGAAFPTEIRRSASPPVAIVTGP